MPHYYYIQFMLYGIAAVVGVRIYASRRFVRIKDILKKSAPANLIADPANFAKSIRPADSSSVTKRLHDTELPHALRSGVIKQRNR